MMRSIRSELLKLRRPSVIYGGGGAMVAFGVLATLVTFLTAEGATPAGAGADGPFAATLARLARPGGLTRGFGIAAGFLGLLVFVVFATSITSEYGHGTLRSLLIRQPARARLLAGKVIALLACSAGALAAAEVASAAAALIMAGIRDVPTADWFSTEALLRAGGDYVNAFLTALFYGTLGISLALLLRSTILALGIGLAWIMPVEHIVQNAWAGAGRWFPGLLFEAVGRGGTEVASYGRALTLAAAFTAAVLLVATTSFLRRDVTV